MQQVASARYSPPVSQLRLTLTEGKYHQVKRMVAAAGNHVATLQRTAFGALQLPPDLAAGRGRWGRTRGDCPWPVKPA
jgi:16S rRNA U516 pseudouridylate synthase RsuA-like enzyme